MNRTQNQYPFYMNPFTGSITLSQSLYNVGPDSYSFTVQASDQRRNPCVDTASVTITVVRVCTDPPTFVQGPYTGSIQESVNNGTTVTTISCTDSVVAGEIVYRATGFSLALAYFQVDGRTGNVFLANAAALRRNGAYDNSYVVWD